jgi:membrane-associated phospholipid phosphatase
MNRSKLIGFLFSLLPFIALAQQKTTLVKKLDSLNKVEHDLKRNPTDSIRQEDYNDTTKLSLRTYFILLGNNLKQQVSAPFHLKGKDWGKVATFGLLTAGVFVADKGINHFAVDLRNRSNSVVSISNFITRFGGASEGYTLAALGAYGFIFKEEKIKTTTLLATQAYLISTVYLEAFKFLASRQRPEYYDPATNKNKATFHGPFYRFKKDLNGSKPDKIRYSSFPSGHATLAFAAATVYSMEYRDRTLVPIIAYSSATLIALSRITENKHWASDVFVGAGLGFLTARQIVNNYHRYAKIRIEEARKKNTLSFNLGFMNGVILPGVVYTFR